MTAKEHVDKAVEVLDAAVGRVKMFEDIPEISLDVRQWKMNEPVALVKGEIIVEHRRLYKGANVVLVEAIDTPESMWPYMTLQRGVIKPDGTFDGDIVSGVVHYRTGRITEVRFRNPLSQGGYLLASYGVAK